MRYGCALLTAAVFGGVARGGDGYSTQIYDGPEWLRLGMTTYPLVQSGPSGDPNQDPYLVYDPAAAWSGYTWLRRTYTDSSAAATAFSTGQKTYNDAINWSNLDTAIAPTIVELMHDAGKATGTVSSVQWSHATPAGLSNAHSRSRSSYESIANQMLDGDALDLIMGCGRPDFNDDGVPITPTSYRYVGGQATWERLTNGTHPGGWRLLSSVQDFESLAAGGVQGRIVGMPQVGSTLQQGRSSNGQGGGYGNPSGDAFNQNVPNLALMARGALTALSTDPDGFFLHIESGAVDWANHDVDLPRAIEEQMAFNRAVEGVVDWIETNSSWDETLLIVTADHETGLLWGPDSRTVPFDPIVDQGYGNLPLARYNSTAHTNSLVPLHARGAGAEDLLTLIDGSDPWAGAEWHLTDGEYVDNTDLFPVMGSGQARNVILMIADGAGFNTFDATSMYEGRWVPAPGGVLAMIVGGLIASRRRRG